MTSYMRKHQSDGCKATYDRTNISFKIVSSAVTVTVIEANCETFTEHAKSKNKECFNETLMRRLMPLSYLSVQPVS